MVCTKEQLAKGIQEFINEDIIPGIEDKPLKMALYTAVQFTGIIDSLLDKPIAKMILNESEGHYDLDGIQAAMSATFDKFGTFPITINPIPFIIPSQVQISLNKNDLNSLMNHLVKVVNYG